jgi:transitional endoplasmic reticulum ATPase
VTAVKGARALPEDVDILLFQAWVADTRGESFPLGRDADQFGQNAQQFWIWFKEAYEAAARKGKIEPDHEALGKNLAWLIRQDAKLNLRQAAESLFRHFENGRSDVASPEDLSAAENWIKKEVTIWLRANGVPVFDGPLSIVPTTALQRVLSPLLGKPDIHFSPTIPEEKLVNAAETCGVPDQETIAVLIDCTFWGSARDAVLFGARGIYYNNGGLNGFLPYAEFVNRTFNVTKDDSEVSLGMGERLSLAGSQVAPVQLISMLEIVRKETVSRQKAARQSEGLESIPGMSDLKQVLLDDVINVLRNAEEYRTYRVSIPNGILFYGPPGCGKTFVAQRLAKELNYNFFEVSPGTIASPYIHDTALKIREIFEAAARSAPAVIFVDEFEGLVPSRRALTGEAQYKSEEVNEWLVQIGSCAENRILFIAATNEPWKIDEAVQRTGRLDKKIYIGPPDRAAIEEMLRFHLDRRPVASREEARLFAASIERQGYSASDLKALVDEAAKLAMKERAAISHAYLLRAAVERVPPSITTEQEEAYLSFR